MVPEARGFAGVKFPIFSSLQGLSALTVNTEQSSTE